MLYINSCHLVSVIVGVFKVEFMVSCQGHTGHMWNLLVMYSRPVCFSVADYVSQL